MISTIFITPLVLLALFIIVMFSATNGLFSHSINNTLKMKEIGKIISVKGFFKFFFVLFFVSWVLLFILYHSYVGQ